MPLAELKTRLDATNYTNLKDFKQRALNRAIREINDYTDIEISYTLKKVNVTDTYVEVQMELPFQPSLGNPHDNFIIVHDDKGRELNMSSGVDGENKIYTQINELVNIEEIPKYLDIFVCTNYGEEENALSTFRVNID